MMVFKDGADEETKSRRRKKNIYSYNNFFVLIVTEM